MRKRSIGLMATLLAIAAGPAFGGTVNILWYTGGTEVSGAGTYEADVNNLVTQEENGAFNTSGSVNTWNVTFWSGGAMPAGSYNVLVAASSEGPWSSTPNYASLTGALNASSFGSRVMLTGQDADWHYANFPGPGNFNGPAGFLIDAINWAGSGTGMGALMLGGSSHTFAFTGIGSVNNINNNTVVIPPAFASFPINSGLTSAGLSGWSISAHEDFTGVDHTLWTPINQDGSGDDITIVSAATASGGTTGGGTVPEASSTFALTFLGVAFLAGFARLARRESPVVS